MRSAVGLIQAIMIILIISGMMIITLKYASISSKHTADTYVKEQTALFLDSAIEQTLLKISEHNRSNGCLATDMIPYRPAQVKKRDINYSAEVTISRYYLQIGSADLTACTQASPQDIGVSIANTSSGSHGMALLEVEAKATKNAGTPNAKVVSRILRRTLQQP